jgi:actin-related protein 4
VPTSYGYIPPTPADPADPSSAEQPARYFLGSTSQVYRPYQEIYNPLRDSIVEDWQAAERLIEHALKDQLRLPSLEENPLLVTEPSWNSKENRERMIELAFEGWDVPAYYSVDRAVLSRSAVHPPLFLYRRVYEHVSASFSVGKGTSLVVDVGEAVTTVSPVYDGFVLRKGGTPTLPWSSRITDNKLYRHSKVSDRRVSLDFCTPIHPPQPSASGPNHAPLPRQKQVSCRTRAAV